MGLYRVASAHTMAANIVNSTSTVAIAMVIPLGDRRRGPLTLPPICGPLFSKAQTRASGLRPPAGMTKQRGENPSGGRESGGEGRKKPSPTRGYGEGRGRPSGVRVHTVIESQQPGCCCH